MANTLDEGMRLEYSIERRQWEYVKDDLWRSREELNERQEDINKRIDEVLKRQRKLKELERIKQTEGNEVPIDRNLLKTVNSDGSSRQIIYQPSSSTWRYADSNTPYGGAVYTCSVDGAYVAEAGIPGPVIMAKALAAFTYPQMR